MVRWTTPLTKLITSIFSLICHKAVYSTKERCSKCKKVIMNQEGSYLYLLPSYLDDEHVEEIDYYLNNSIPLQDESQIPPGRRACYFNVFCCPECGYRDVAIIDFLNVRDNQLVKGGESCEYAKVSDFLMQTQADLRYNN